MLETNEYVCLCLSFLVCLGRRVVAKAGPLVASVLLSSSTLENACHVVCHKILWMVWVVICHQEKLPDCQSAQAQHGASQFLQGLSLQHHAPQVNAIPQMESWRICLHHTRPLCA